MYENGAPLCETAWGRLLLQHAGALCEAALALTAEARGIVQAEQALAGYAPARRTPPFSAPFCKMCAPPGGTPRLCARTAMRRPPSGPCAATRAAIWTR